MNLEMKYARYGLAPYKWSAKTSSYSALADAKIETSGSWELPLAVYSYPPEDEYGRMVTSPEHHDGCYNHGDIVRFHATKGRSTILLGQEILTYWGL